MSLVWPNALVQAIARRRAVVLIGSGVSANAQTDDGVHPPTWGAFLEHAYNALGRRVPHIKKSLTRYSYLEACAYLREELGEQWTELIRDSFWTPQYRPAEIHKAIFDLDSRIVTSLNFDRIYEIYAIAASENTIIVKNYYDGDLRQAVAGGDRYIIKPHGTVDTASRLIFTLDDYAKARTQHGAFYEVLTALLHTHVFLCIGCGLSDPDMQLIFEDYRTSFAEAPHYMTMPRPFASPEAALVKRTRGLNILTYSARDNHKELTSALSRLGEMVAAKREEIAALQSW